MFGSTLAFTALLSSSARRSRMWGFVVALLSQPVWFYVGWTTGQWSLWSLALIFAVLHTRGILNNRT